MAASPRLSIVIPALNEANAIDSVLRPLQPLRAEVAEIILVDGGSEDGTVEKAEELVDQLLRSERGRARQMNAGARAARGEILLFLHADTLLPARAADAVLEAMDQETHDWGRFDVRLSGRHPLLRMVETMISLRSRLNGIATGDQAIFVRRKLFEEIGGYQEIPLMEDVALSRELAGRGKPACLGARVTTSSRRWEEQGIWRTIFLMWRLRWAYARGADPEQLAKRYGCRDR